MKQITDKSIYLWVLKWLPVIGTALIASHYAMLPFGYKSSIIDYITDVSLFAWIYLYFASKLFFCKLHRAFCIYIGVASLDIDLHNWFDLDFLEPQWLIPLIMITTAIVLAYASEWASLCLFAANQLYDKLWQRIKNQRHRNHR